MLLENIGSVVRTLMFNLHLYALLCHFHVNWSLEMQFGVVQLEKLARTQPVIAFSTLEFHSSVFAFSRAHMAPILLHCVGQCLLCLATCIFIFSWHVGEACLPCLVVWGWDSLPTSCIRSHSTVCLNCCCDNFEQHEVRMIKLLRIVNPRMWKNSFVNF